MSARNARRLAGLKTSLRRNKAASWDTGPWRIAELTAIDGEIARLYCRQGVIDQVPEIVADFRAQGFRVSDWQPMSADHVMNGVVIRVPRLVGKGPPVVVEQVRPKHSEESGR